MPFSSGISRRNFLAASAAALAAPHLAGQSTSGPPEPHAPSAIESLPNLSGQARPFTNAERMARIERARELMTLNKIDAIVLANSTSSSVYFANLHLYGGERLWALILPAQSKPLLVCPAFEEGRAHDLLASGPLAGILAVSKEPLVSIDYTGDFHSSTVDALSTNVVDGTLVHVSSWYDNEMGYSARCVDLMAYMGSKS
jgi:hypothetical protein